MPWRKGHKDKPTPKVDEIDLTYDRADVNPWNYRSTQRPGQRPPRRVPCPKCGKENIPTASVCVNCGNSLTPVETPKEEEPDA